MSAVSGSDPQWVVVLPVKELPLAKTRLAKLAPADRADVALAMACDVVVAALASAAVGAVIVTTNDLRAAADLERLGARVVADSADSGLNAALTDAARVAGGWYPRSPVAALSSDLPALRTEELTAALAAASRGPRAFVPDRQTIGTTMLTAAAGVPLDPQFGSDSRVRHRNTGATELMNSDWLGLRCDVDTDVDLRRAGELGVGPHTAAVLTRLGLAG